MKKEQLPVFVYGTLRPGFSNYNWCLQGKTVREDSAVINGTLHMVSGRSGFPCLLPGQDLVVGVLVYPNPANYDQILNSLDRLEGFCEDDPNYSMYLRKITLVTTATGKDVLSWVYYWNRDRVGDLITNGDWANPEFAEKEEVSNVG